MSLQTPPTVRKLQAALHGKAKAEPGYRFYLLYDKVYRTDVLAHAYARCRENRGAAGVDNQDFQGIEAYGVERWLGELAQELRNRTYKPQALRREWIPKPDGKQRPLGIPTIRDRVVQMAAVLVLGPIFEADLPPEQYAYREGRSALDAVEAVNQWLHQGCLEVVDADLSGYLETATYCTPVHEGAWKRPGCSSITLIRRPLRLPQRTWTAFSSPRFTRCNTVCRETPSRCVASSIGR